MNRNALRPRRPTGFRRTLLSLALLLAPGTSLRRAAGMPAVTNVPFTVYRVPKSIAPHAHRDIEFLVSHTYADSGFSLFTPIGGMNMIDRLGRALCEVHSNPLGYPVSDLELAFDYLTQAPAAHAVYADSGLYVNAPQLDPPNANHIDFYLYAPNTKNIFYPSWKDPAHPFVGDAPGDRHAALNHGLWWSDFGSPLEDTSSGRPIGIDPTYHLNSCMLPGPRFSDAFDTTWASPEGSVASAALHEFQHTFNQGKPSYSYTEFFSVAAQVLTDPVPASFFDFTYTRSLLADSTDLNYEGWESFDAYLAFNLQGLVPGYAGRSDDVLWRWAHGANHTFNGLASCLDSLSCPTCDYFDGLTPAERMGTLVHDWRIANYVDNYALDRHRYGFDPAYGFHPSTNLGAFQDLDGYLFNNASTVPTELRATPRWRARDTTLTSHPAGDGYAARPLIVPLWGSEYFVVHADPMLGAATDTLTVRLGAEGLSREVLDDAATAGCDTSLIRRGRLRASLVRYSGDADSLFRHPEWATDVTTQTLDVDGVTGELVFQVPGFGAATKAALIVATLEPQGTNELSLGTAPLIERPLQIPLRFSAGIRTAPVAFATPQAVAPQGTFEDFGAWSPHSDSVAFSGTLPPDTTWSQVYRVGLDGGAATHVFPQPAAQRAPDWSPRGDWIAFEQDSAGGVPKVWLAPAGAGAARRLTARAGAERAPVFRPDGRQIAYGRAPSPPTGGYELRVSDLAGDDDHLVTTTPLPVTFIRWSPDGRSLYYMVTQPGLVSRVSSAGGAPAYWDSAGATPPWAFDFHPAGGAWTAERSDFAYAYQCQGGLAQPVCGPCHDADDNPLPAGTDVYPALGEHRVTVDSRAPGIAVAESTFTDTRFSTPGGDQLIPAGRPAARASSSRRTATCLRAGGSTSAPRRRTGRRRSPVDRRWTPCCRRDIPTRVISPPATRMASRSHSMPRSCRRARRSAATTSPGRRPRRTPAATSSASARWIPRADSIRSWSGSR